MRVCQSRDIITLRVRPSDRPASEPGVSVDVGCTCTHCHRKQFAGMASILATFIYLPVGWMDGWTAAWRGPLDRGENNNKPI